MQPRYLHPPARQGNGLGVLRVPGVESGEVEAFNTYMNLLNITIPRVLWSQLTSTTKVKVLMLPLQEPQVHEAIFYFWFLYKPSDGGMGQATEAMNPNGCSIWFHEPVVGDGKS